MAAMSAVQCRATAHQISSGSRQYI